VITDEAHSCKMSQQVSESQAAVKKLEQQLKAVPGAAKLAEIEAAHRRALTQQKAEAKAEYAKMLNEIQRLQNTVFQLMFGAVP